MKSVLTITIVVLSVLALLGVLMGLQQIVTYPAQIALEEYDRVHQAKQESDIVTPPETLKESTKSEHKGESITEPVQTEPVQTEPVQTEPVQTEPTLVCSGNAKCITGVVGHIVDGDTLYIDEIKIRISLADTPEIGDKGYSEATEFTKSLCPEGSIVQVDQDDLQLYDKFNRMLGKVTCSGRVLNSELLFNNLAKISSEYCSTSEFSNESWAQQYGCAKEIQVTTPQVPKEIPKPSSDQNNCDPSYPDFCISPYPPDLDCKDVKYKKFTVLPPDPHKFDIDKDGIGCES
jgi:micrococcal nuclease